MTDGRRRRRRAEARGVGMLELVATVFLLGLVLATVFAGFTSTQAALGGADERLRNLDEARVLMAVASKDLRTAVRLDAASSPFLVAGPLEARFHANLDPDAGPKLVRIWVDDEDRLIEHVWDPDPGSVPPAYTYTGAPRVRFVGRYVANDATTPVFTYLDADDAPLGPGPLSPQDRLAIRAVRITLVVKRDTDRVLEAVTVVNRVRLPNLDYQAVAE